MMKIEDMTSLRASRVVIGVGAALALGAAMSVIPAASPDPAASTMCVIASDPPPAAAPPISEPPAICNVRVRGYSKTRSPDAQVEPGPPLVAGALSFTRVDVELDNAKLSSALRALARAARVNLVPLYRVRDGDPGLDASALVTLSLEDVSAMEALEALLAASTGMIDSTWQIRGNLVECGPKVLLAESSRRETRVYDITDLRMEMPYYEPRLPGDPDADRFRRKPKEISADFVRMVINNVEPDAWREPAETPGASPVPASNLDGEGTAEIFVRGQWASIHLKNDRLMVVNAPDFIHRQIGGMGEMVPPLARDVVDPPS